MTDRGDELLRKVTDLPDPALPAQRAQQIQELARARFLASEGAPASRAARARVGEVATAALLSACVVAYLTWTAVTVASLQEGSQGVLVQRASSGARH